MRIRPLSLGLALLLLLSTLPLMAQARTEYRAYWVDTFNTALGTHADIDRLVQNCVDSNCNALFAQIRRRGDSWYLDTLEPLTQVAGVGEPDASGNWTFDPLLYLIQTAHAHGIEVHAYVIIGSIYNAHPTITGVPTDSRHVFNQHFWDGTKKVLLADTNPQMWSTRALPHYTDGTTFTGHRFTSAGEWYIDLGHPDAEAYTVDVLTHLVQAYDVDGLHLDRIRFPEAPIDYAPGRIPGINVGYNETSVQRYKARYPSAAVYQTSDIGTLANSSPLRNITAGDVGYPKTYDAQWNQWRRDQVTNFVRRLYLSVTAVKPRVKLSAALICFWTGPAGTIGGWVKTEPYYRVFQDWKAWTEEGILDLVAPMDYRAEHTTGYPAQFDDWMSFTKTLAATNNRQSLIGPGIYLNGVEGSLRQIRRSLGLPPWETLPSADGVILYAIGNTTPGTLDHNSTNVGTLANWQTAVVNNPFSYPTPGLTTPKRTNADFFAALLTGANANSTVLFESTALTPVFAGGPAAIPPMPWKESPTLGHLRGFARRADATPLDTADVTMENVSTGATRTTVTDGGGFFGGVSLPPGSYRSRVTLGGDTVYGCIAGVSAGLVSSSDARPELTAPATSLSQSATDWSKVDVTVSLTPTDDCSGVVATEIAYDGGAWQPYSSTITFVTEGVTALQYRSRDWAGNVETAKNTTVKIDKTAPAVTITAPADGSTFVYGQATTATFDCTDALSGIATCSGSSANGGAVDTSIVGARTFTVAASDLAGNVTSKSHSYTVGKAATTMAFTYIEERNRVTLVATLSVVAPGGGVPAGTVEFIDKHGSLGVAPVVNGVAALSIQKRSLQLTITYSGSTNHLGVSSAELHFEPRPE